MPHTPLISTIVIGLVLAFVLGALANRLRVSPLVSYLLAGVAVGPFTPGFVADQAIARDLAEIGVILLMFGVGLQFSPKELLSVKAIAIPGALLQIVMATADRHRDHARQGGGLCRRYACRWPAGHPVGRQTGTGLAGSKAARNNEAPVADVPGSGSKD